jgi:hypothetical protein
MYLDTSLRGTVPDVNILTRASDYQSTSLSPPTATQQTPLSICRRLNEIRASNVQC